ncbi:XisH family protein [Dapis sp. BLCC M229]|uniref:XisH family protein n=1 Tax=Dapis sp. BLCC M229 TaxID=3400188 RepID=UPI003CF1A450
MPARDSIHNLVKQAIIKDGWEITDDPYVISYGERFLFIDLAATGHEFNNGNLIAAKQGNFQLAVEIKEFRGNSPIVDLEQAIGQYILYQLLLKEVDPVREIYLAISSFTYNNIFSESIGELVINNLPMKLLVVDLEKVEVLEWIPQRPIEKSSNK